MSVKIDFNPDYAHLSVQVDSSEPHEIHGSFLETLRRLIRRAHQVNVDLSALQQVDDNLRPVMLELREIPGDSTIILRVARDSEALESCKALFENRRPIVRH